MKLDIRYYTSLVLLAGCPSCGVMDTAFDRPTEQYSRAPTLQRYLVYFVRVCGFTFEFYSVEQIEVCLKFFSQKVRPSSMIQFSESDRRIHWLHWVCQCWFERLPMQILEERRRVRIVPALRKALAQFKNGVDHAA